jgi:SAM-dependent methyltransferase
MHEATPLSNDACSDYSGTELEALARAVNYHRWIVEQFRPYLGETVAEVGAGMGSVSKLLLEGSVKRLFAFEPSANMFPHLENELRNEPRAVAINELFSPNHAPDGVDSVVYINVLEHIEDDLAELRNAYSAVRPKGHLMVFVPALAWLYSDFDRHVGHFRRYTRRQLRELAETAGFEVTSARYFDFVGILPWYVSFVLLKSRPNALSVTLYDKLVVPPMRLVERFVSPPWGKNVLLIARKV